MNKKMQIRNSTTDFLVFTKVSKGGDSIEVRVQDGNVWLTPKAIGQLFDIERSVATKHLQNVFASGELVEKSTCAKFAQVADADVSIAKNYLKNHELTELNEIITMYPDYAIRQARHHIPMMRHDCANKLDAFLQFNEADLLKDAGKVSAEVAKAFAESEFEKTRVIQDYLYKSDFDRLIEESNTLPDGKKGEPKK